MSVINQLKIRGDTLIEVLFAITIFSLTAVGGLSIMNQGTAISQRALEITLVRQEIDAQAEALRFLNSSYVAAYQSGLDYGVTPAGQWASMLENISDNEQASDFSLMASGDCSSPAGSFAIDTRNAKFIKPADNKLSLAQTYSQVRYNSDDQVTAVEGLWIEAVHPDIKKENGQNNADYVDFHIRACWDSPGQSVPVTLGTIVRLYEPR